MFQSTAPRGFTSYNRRDSPILVLLALLQIVTVANGFLNSRPALIHHQQEITRLAARFQQRRKSNTAAFYASTEDPPLPRHSVIASKSFGNRMRDLVLRENESEKINRQQQHDDMPGRSKINPSKPAFVHEAVTLQSYKKLVADEHEKLVVVRFYAKWCRVSCFLG